VTKGGGAQTVQKEVRQRGEWAGGRGACAEVASPFHTESTRRWGGPERSGGTENKEKKRSQRSRRGLTQQRRHTTDIGDSLGGVVSGGLRESRGFLGDSCVAHTSRRLRKGSEGQGHDNIFTQRRLRDKRRGKKKITGVKLKNDRGNWGEPLKQKSCRKELL